MKMKKSGEAYGAKNSMTFVPVGLNIQRPNVLPPILGLRRFYVHICLLAIFIVLVIIVRAIANVKVIFVQYHTESDTDGELLVLPEDYAKRKSAFCLDGSPPGYYIRMGKSPNINNWIIHLPSGSWCSTDKECYDRSFTELGSSAKAPVSAPFSGILAASKVENPDFYTWNMVQFLYCDGSSFTGNRKSTTEYKSKALYYRGHLIFSALVDYLMEHTSINSADQVILSGSSAGGLAALINVDFLRRKLNNVKSVHAVLDGMLFIDQPTKSGQHVMLDILKKMFYLHHSHEAESIQDCTSNLSVTDQWKCLQPTYFYKHIFTPVFFVGSAYDLWFIRHPLGVTCSLISCPSEDKMMVEKYKENIMKSIQPVIFSVHDGIFLTSCPVHTLLLKPWYSSKITVNYMTLQQAIGQWYFHRYPKNFKNTENFTFTQVMSRCPPIP